MTWATSMATDDGRAALLAGRWRWRALEVHARCTAAGPHHDGVRQLVVPALLARIDADPDEPQAHRKERNVVGEIATDELPGRRLHAGVGINDARANGHLAGRCLPRGPEDDDRKGG